MGYVSALGNPLPHRPGPCQHARSHLSTSSRVCQAHYVFSLVLELEIVVWSEDVAIAAGVRMSRLTPLYERRRVGAGQIRREPSGTALAGSRPRGGHPPSGAPPILAVPLARICAPFSCACDDDGCSRARLRPRRGVRPCDTRARHCDDLT